MKKDFSKGTYNYPPTVERAVHLLKKYKIKFEYSKKGANLISDEEEVAFIEREEDGEVYLYMRKKEM